MSLRRIHAVAAGQVATGPRAPVPRLVPVLAALAVALWGGAGTAAEQTTEVGPVTATVRVQPAAPRIGDAIQLELVVTAEAGVELLMPEFGEALDRYAIVDFAPSETVDDAGRTIARHRYTLQAARSGSQAIPPLLVEFIDRRPGRTPTPDDSDAYELLTERLDFEVESVLSSDDSLVLRAALGELGARRLPGPPRWLWWVAGGLLVLAASPFAARAFFAWREQRLRLSAYQVAKRELDALVYAPQPTGDAIGPFYVTLSGIVRRYLEDRFGLRSPEQTTEEFLVDLASSPDLGREHQTLLRDFLRGADLVKFAHHLPDAAGVQASIAFAARFLEETGEKADA